MKNLIYKKIIKIERSGSLRLGAHLDELIFITEGGFKFKMYHMNECAETARLDNTIGKIDDLFGSYVLDISAYEDEGFEKWFRYKFTKKNKWGEKCDSHENVYPEYHNWVFIRVTTEKGSVIFRWFIESEDGFNNSEILFEEIK